MLYLIDYKNQTKQHKNSCIGFSIFDMPLISNFFYWIIAAGLVFFTKLRTYVQTVTVVKDNIIKKSICKYNCNGADFDFIADAITAVKCKLLSTAYCARFQHCSGRGVKMTSFIQLAWCHQHRKVFLQFLYYYFLCKDVTFLLLMCKCEYAYYKVVHNKALFIFVNTAFSDNTYSLIQVDI